MSFPRSLRLLGAPTREVMSSRSLSKKSIEHIFTRVLEVYFFLFFSKLDSSHIFPATAGRSIAGRSGRKVATRGSNHCDSDKLHALNLVRVWSTNAAGLMRTRDDVMVAAQGTE